MRHSTVIERGYTRVMQHEPLNNSAATARRPTPARALVKAIGLMLELVAAMLILSLLFPRLQRTGKLDHTRRWARRVLAILQVEVRCAGMVPSDCAGLVVANHVSWLDILVIQSLMPGIFVAKAEVRRWPLFGRVAQGCSTIFVRRSSSRSARAMVDASVAAFGQGYSVVAFPEGTSTDGSDLGVFHANIFEAAIRSNTPVQPLTLRYLDARTGLPSDAALFIGETSLLSSLRAVMATSSLTTQVHVGACIDPSGQSRKSLAMATHQAIRGQLMALCETVPSVG